MHKHLKAGQNTQQSKWLENYNLLVLQTSFPLVQIDPLLKVLFQRIPEMNERNNVNPVSSVLCVLPPLVGGQVDEIANKSLQSFAESDSNFAPNWLWQLEK